MLRRVPRSPTQLLSLSIRWATALEHGRRGKAALDPLPPTSPACLSHASSQDPLGAPSLAIAGNASSATSVWVKQLAPGGPTAGVTAIAVTLLNAAIPTSAAIGFNFSQLGPVGAACAASPQGCNVTDLWSGTSVVVGPGVPGYTTTVSPHEAALLRVEVQASSAWV
jgi:hypothetical protein